MFPARPLSGSTLPTATQPSARFLCPIKAVLRSSPAPKLPRYLKRLKSTSRDNSMAETRQFTLTDNGPANVVEITHPRAPSSRAIAASMLTGPTPTLAKLCAATSSRNIFPTISPRSIAPTLPISQNPFSSPSPRQGQAWLHRARERAGRNPRRFHLSPAAR